VRSRRFIDSWPTQAKSGLDSHFASQCGDKHQRVSAIATKERDCGIPEGSSSLEGSTANNFKGGELPAVHRACEQSDDDEATEGECDNERERPLVAEP
jgi:hypothetical protein